MFRNSEPPLLQVKDLRTKLKIGNDYITVIDKLEFNLYRGKTLALVGESGCGKSMTALSILRILPVPPALPPEGEVIYNGRNLLTLTEKEMRSIRGSKIAMIFQDPMSALNPVYTIGNQLVEVAEIHLGLYGRDAFERVVKVLADVGILSPEKRFYDYPHQLSGGMKQRVMIAMALICEPDILIADEPTTALDVTIQAQILKLMKELQERKGMAILLITHDMGVVAEIADEVIVMYLAQGIEHSETEELFQDPLHPYTKGLLNSRPSVQKPGTKLQSIIGTVPSFRHIPQGCRFHPRCPYVMEKCKSNPVPNFIINENTVHMAKCWLYDKTEESNRQLLKEYKSNEHN